MYCSVVNTYDHLEWEYLEVSRKLINERYDWINFWYEIENKRYPWAHERDIKALFLLCRTFPSKEEALICMESELIKKLNPIHNSLMDWFCYSKTEESKSIDELIEETSEIGLLYFIQNVLDRSLLWWDPEVSWPSDFKGILAKTAVKLEKNNITFPLEFIHDAKVQGVDFVSYEQYTHVFYKYENLMNEIEKGISYELRVLARQSHEVLLKSMRLFFDYEFSFFGHEFLERKLDEIEHKETAWCIERLL